MSRYNTFKFDMISIPDNYAFRDTGIAPETRFFNTRSSKNMQRIETTCSDNGDVLTRHAYGVEWIGMDQDEAVCSSSSSSSQIVSLQPLLSRRRIVSRAHLVFVVIVVDFDANSSAVGLLRHLSVRPGICQQNETSCRRSNAISLYGRPLWKYP